MMKFCFPERDPDMIEETEEADNKSKKSKSSSKRNRDSNFYVNIERNQIDDVEKMKVSDFFCGFRIKFNG